MKLIFHRKLDNDAELRNLSTW